MRNRLARYSFQSSAQPMTALGATRLDDRSTGLTGHAVAKPMTAGPTAGIWLKSTFHSDGLRFGRLSVRR
ncbi:uncharacterized protein METZ01_LOCUS18191 [marine metagenome]|uniref:Uncharacterized protein n=1 Tax=marine metagenome TaxID=408172 RepID=A0A381PGK2_9ZZZZ